MAAEERSSAAEFNKPLSLRTTCRALHHRSLLFKANAFADAKAENPAATRAVTKYVGTEYFVPKPQAVVK